jgi:phthalate 4,5-dioxygenase reductase subunit
MTSVEELTPLALKVGHVSKVAREITLFELSSPDGTALPPFQAGAHLFVRAPNGLLRQYSICNAPSDSGRYVIAVKRDAAGRGGSISMTDDLKPGDLVNVSAPRNAFPLLEDAPRYLFIAGGIGITPIRSMMLHLAEAGVDNYRLYYCTRSTADAAFAEEFGASGFKGKVVIHHDEGDPERQLDLWPVLENPGRTHLYCCGPGPLMQAVRDMTGHWPASAVHFEDFGSARLKPHRADHAFIVRLARSGRCLEVPASESMLQTLHRAGVSVASSCESGTCGSCRVGLISGNAEHRDFVLSEPERQEAIMPCVSRARNAGEELVLDL